MLEVVENLGGNAKETDNAPLVELVVAAELQLTMLCNLNVNDVLCETGVWQHGVKDGLNGLVLQLQDGEILNRPNRAAT